MVETEWLTISKNIFSVIQILKTGEKIRQICITEKSFLEIDKNLYQLCNTWYQPWSLIQLYPNGYTQYTLALQFHT
jgi:hypothetical protein